MILLSLTRRHADHGGYCNCGILQFFDNGAGDDVGGCRLLSDNIGADEDCAGGGLKLFVTALRHISL